MCGIAGLYRFDGRAVDMQLLQTMTDVLAHRGPDGEGHFVDGPVGLGNRRLAILDLSPAGHQPMSNEDGTVWITYNGEVYNFRELRCELEQKGHRFRSNTDTEVLVHLYEEEGERLVERLNGMFAFALWDERRQRLLLVRDPIGIKPLFYFVDDSALRFGSEIKAILCDPEVPRRLDERALHLFLTFNYVPLPRTLFQDIRQLPPGHILLVEGSSMCLFPYWDWHVEDESRWSKRDSKERFEALLSKAVCRTLVSDVPFGLFLSGGLDSSTLLHFMAQALHEPVRSFSIGFEEPSYSELDAAQTVATQYHTKHHERVICPEELPEILPKLVWYADEPLADASMVPTYFVSRLAREHVKMVLCGDGGDELLAGYETYTAYYLARVYRILPEIFRRNLAKFVQALPVSDCKYSFEMKAKRFVYAAELPLSQAHGAWRVALTELQKRQLYTKDFAARVCEINPFEVFADYVEQAPTRRPLHRLLYADLRLYLPSDLLAKVDHMSMACSLEVRVPLLDRELVEFLATVPPSLKLRHFVDKKYLLKRVMQHKLPPHILRRPKQGFVVPVGPWLRGPLRDFAHQVLTDPLVKRLGYFREETVQKLLDEHSTGRRDHSYALWGLLTFVLWYNTFFEGG